MVGFRRKAAAFIAINALIAAAAFLVLIREPAAEAKRTAELVKIQERRLDIKKRNLDEIEYNRAAFESQSLTDPPIGGALSYGGVASAFASFFEAARENNLIEKHFEAGEPVAADSSAGGGLFVEIAAEAVYEGSREDLTKFIDGLPRDTFFIKRLFFEISGDDSRASSARVVFSVFASAPGD